MSLSIKFLFVFTCCVASGGFFSTPTSSTGVQAARFPDERKLMELAANGDIINRLQIKLKPISNVFSKSVAGDNNGASLNSNSSSKSPSEQNHNGDNEDLLLQNQAQRILDEIADSCHSFRRLFRPAGKFEQDHRQAGLHYWFVYECGQNSAGRDAEGVVSQHVGDGQEAVAALSKLNIMVNEMGDPNNFGIDIATAEYRVQETVIKESLQDVFPSSSSGGGTSKNEQSPRHLKGNDSRSRRQELAIPGERAVPNDPWLRLQSHYDAINLREAWKIMTNENAWSRCKDVVVQVLDSGWDMAHADSGMNRWTNPGEDCSIFGSGNGADDDGNGYIDDCHGYNHADNSGTNLLGDGNHGSHCTGTIAANTDNRIGVAGIAGGRRKHRGVSIMTSVGLGSSGPSGFADALVYAADNGAHISSNSWGWPSIGYYEKAVLEAIDYADARGVLVVFAAGNEGANAEYCPAFYSKVIAVAATDNDGFAASFTNFGGDWVDIAAPGVRILSTGLSKYQPYITSDEYIFMSGTSMACPHVSGVLALGKCLYPSATALELKNCLFDTATDIDDPDLGSGLVNPPGFLNCVLDLMESTATDQECVCSGDCHQWRPGETGCSSCSFCEAAVCSADFFCCIYEWDDLCAYQAYEICPCTCDFYGCAYENNMRGQRVRSMRRLH
ncbi:hypothetical protein ACA910_020851 [Epithemia clementina (nom. ined.)]